MGVRWVAAIPEVPVARRSSRRKMWLHRGLALLCVVMAYPAIRWWRDSILFVILLSLATQASASWSASEAADDRELADRLDRIEERLRELPDRS